MSPGLTLRVSETRWWIRYGFAAAAALLACGLRAAMEWFSPDGLQFIAAFPAVAVVAYWAGTGPAILTAVAAGAIVSLWLLDWHHIPSSSFAIVSYAGVCALLIWPIHRLLAAQEHDRLLTRELFHRTRNLMSIMVAMIMMTLKGKQHWRDERDKLVARITALAASDALLIDGLEGQSVDIAEIARVVISPLCGDGVRADFAKQNFDPTATRAVTLILHELATNAIKHGALSVPDGCVFLRGRSSEGNYEITWEETGGPPIDGAIAAGQGIWLLTNMAKHMQGEADIKFEREGLHYRACLPVAA